MIEYCYEIDFQLEDENRISNWISKVVERENREIHNLVYVFCGDDRLLQLNKQFLNHDSYTDILTFPYQEENGIHADIFISVPRVRENAKNLGIDEDEELRRVMIHGVLHLLGYNDGNSAEKERMRAMEDAKLKMFHVEQ